MPNVKDTFLAQFELVLEQFKELAKKTQYPDYSDISYEEYARFRTTSFALINRVAGSNSVYAKQAESFPIDEKNFDRNLKQIPFLAGIVSALHEDVLNGFLDTARELIHGELFSDFLEMADFLVNEGYKDAAAIMGGGVLEAHLQQLCLKNEIDLKILISGKEQIKRADRLNSDLVSGGIYSKLDQKSVTSWLDLRNNAAHAHYNEYSKEQVVLFLQGIRDFITRHPA